MAVSDLSLASQLTVARQELRQLRRRQREAAATRAAARWASLVAQAYTDAVLLVGLAGTLQDVSRAAAPLPARRWIRAVALLRLAGLVRERGHVRIQARSPASAAAKLVLARDRATTHPELLNLHLPASRRVSPSR